MVRSAEVSDAGAIAAIYDPIVAATAISLETEPPGADEIARRITGITTQYPYLVACRRDAILGYAYASPFRVRAAYRWSVDVTVYVAAEGRRQGVGRALYAVLLPSLRAQNYRTAFAIVTLPNEASLALHASMGFTRTGTFPGAGHKLGRAWDIAVLCNVLRNPAEPALEPIAFKLLKGAQ